MTTTIEAGGRRIEVSNTDKVFFPDNGITKGEVVEYYHRIGETMLPHAVDRPLTLHRFPDGIGSEGFFQKNTPDHFPDWITRERLEKEGGTVVYPVCTELATLVYIADQGCITPHVWLSRVDRPHEPDRMIFDLDPPEGSEDIGLLHDAVRAVKGSLDDLGVPSFLMTTGSAGYHVLVPLDGSDDFDVVHDLSRRLARGVVERFPDLTTVEQRKDQRDGKVFVDYLRNSYAQTTAVPYSLRALPGAPVATPIEWDELGDSEPRRWSIGNIFRRLGQVDDPWHRLADTDVISAAEITERIEE